MPGLDTSEPGLQWKVRVVPARQDALSALYGLSEVPEKGLKFGLLGYDGERAGSPVASERLIIQQGLLRNFEEFLRITQDCYGITETSYGILRKY